MSSSSSCAATGAAPGAVLWRSVGKEPSCALGALAEPFSPAPGNNFEEKLCLPIVFKVTLVI